MEQSDELGYAHFMEHLTFRGSRHVPDGESKRIWQRLGVTFGSDSNAQTTPTVTTYALDLPQATQASLGDSMQLLAGMMADPNTGRASGRGRVSPYAWYPVFAVSFKTNNIEKTRTPR